MACHLVGAKPLSEPMRDYRQLDPWEQKFSEIFIQNSYIFIQEKAFEQVVCKMAAILSRPQCVKYVENYITILIWFWAYYETDQFTILPLLERVMILLCQFYTNASHEWIQDF